MGMDVQLGLGLIGIGRSWGHVPQPVPPEAEARALLEAAFELGIKVFDTAPAYGQSERILGAFLRTLTDEERRTVFIATKFGEHWNDDGSTRVDHSYDALMRSLDASVEHLRDIDLIQVHKASVDVLSGEDLRWALEGAQAMDIPQIGASVADIEAGRQAISMGFHWLQLPFSVTNAAMLPLFIEAAAADIRIMSNRPFASGAALAGLDGHELHETLATGYAFAIGPNGGGVVLTGTRSSIHLAESIAAFGVASQA